MSFGASCPSGFGLNLIAQLFTRSKCLEEGESALHAGLEKVLGSITLNDIWHDRQIALAVTAVDMNSYRSWVFKTPHNPNSNHRDDETTLVDVCMASSAAPFFRSLAVNDVSSEHFENVQYVRGRRSLG